MKSSMKRSRFGFQTWKFQEHPKSFLCHIVLSIKVEKQGLDIFNLCNSSMHEREVAVLGLKHGNFKKKLHFRETKKDPCLPFYFHVLNLFKSCSNLGFDQDSNG